MFETDKAKPPDTLEFCLEPDLGETVLHKTDIPANMRFMLAALTNISRLGDWVWTVLRLFIK